MGKKGCSTCFSENQEKKGVISRVDLTGEARLVHIHFTPKL